MNLPQQIFAYIYTRGRKLPETALDVLDWTAYYLNKAAQRLEERLGYYEEWEETNEHSNETR